MTWSQFITRVQGLFMIDSRLSRHFAPSEPNPVGEDEIS